MLKTCWSSRPKPDIPFAMKSWSCCRSKLACEPVRIANLTWPMLVEPTGEIARSLELQDRAAKKGSGRVIPIHPDLHADLVKLAQLTLILDGPVIQSEHGGPMSPDPTTRNALPNQATMLMIYSFSFQGISDQVAIIWRNMAEARNRQSHRGL